MCGREERRVGELSESSRSAVCPPFDAAPPPTPYTLAYSGAVATEQVENLKRLNNTLLRRLKGSEASASAATELRAQLAHARDDAALAAEEAQASRAEVDALRAELAAKQSAGTTDAVRLAVEAAEAAEVAATAKQAEVNDLTHKLERAEAVVQDVRATCAALQEQVSAAEVS